MRLLAGGAGGAGATKGALLVRWVSGDSETAAEKEEIRCWRPQEDLTKAVAQQGKKRRQREVQIYVVHM